MAVWDRFFGSSVSTAAGYGMGSALSPALEPITQAIANEVWARYPDRPLTPEEAAEAVVRAVMTVGEAEAESLANGINKSRFATLRALAGEPPAPQELLALWNRGQLTEARVDAGLRQSRMRPEWYDAFKQLRHVLVPVSDLIRFAVREVFNPDLRAALDLDAEYPAALTPHADDLGLAESDARNYWAAHWQLPSAEQGFEMFHRGELSGAQLDGLLKALDYAPTWRGKLRTLAARIPPISDMIRFAVREVYDPAQRQSLGLDADYPDAFTGEAALHGMDEARARQYWAAHWRLPSAQQGYSMLWRGQLTQAGLSGLLKALDYPAVWRDRLQAIAYHVPGRIDLRRMYAAGVITRAEMKAGYGRLGYTDADAERLTDLAVALSAGSDTDYPGKARTQLWTTLHRAYMAGDATEAQALAKLEQTGVPQTQRADVVAVWNHERELVRARLTPAQVKKAWVNGVTNRSTGVKWTRDDALTELVQRGWSAVDANTLLDE